jgi:hypothetical protein
MKGIETRKKKMTNETTMLATMILEIVRDEKDLNRYELEVSQKGDSQLRLIETLVRHYADVNKEEL